MLVRVHHAVSAPVTGSLFNPEDNPKPGVLVPIRRAFGVASGPSDVSLELLGTGDQARSQCLECNLAFLSYCDWAEVHFETPSCLRIPRSTLLSSRTQMIAPGG